MHWFKVRMSTHWNLQYRPRSVDSIHLESVKSILRSLLSAPLFPHVFLFAGPKGTGKTSASRIIAAILNEPANEKAVKSRLFGETVKNPPPFVDATPGGVADTIFTGESYLVAEMDAASNRGIDDVRALKERAHVGPLGGLVSVYILDEVHMLSNDAFNALLKLLEEPPKHAVFILATTELHKIPDTIISRCTVVPFQRARPNELVTALSTIAEAEKLSVTSEDLQSIALLADGSFRDAVKYLELQSSLGEGSVHAALHIPATSLCWDLLSAVIDKSETRVLTILENARETGLDEKHLVRMLVRLLHDDILASYGVIDEKPHFSERISIFLLSALSSLDLVNASPIPHLRLELSLLDLIGRAKDKNPTATPGGNNAATQEKQPAKAKKAPEGAKIAQSVDTLTEESNEPATVPSNANVPPVADSFQVDVSPPPDDDVDVATLDIIPASGSPTDAQLGDGNLVVERWQELITRVSNHNFSLAALLKSATPLKGSQGETTVRVYYEFHKDQLLQPRWLALLQELLTELAGGYVKLHCVVQSHKESEILEPQTSPSLERLAVEALT